MIDTILRMVDYMYHNSYDLGSNNWVKKDSLRFMRNNEKPYNLTLEELKGLSDIDFTKIELVFAPII
jgi:hypothetical protein